MIIKASDIKLFENLSQYDFGTGYLDFHNDFSCTKISFQRDILELSFEDEKNYKTFIRFYDISLIVLDFDFNESLEPLIIDNLYRGRNETNNSLIEFLGEKGYFYLEFVAGQNLEFWSTGIIYDGRSGY